MISSKSLTVAEAFSESVLHDRHLVLGRELHPFCLDHWVLLDALKSPLLTGGKIEITDLQLAVQVCSTSSVQEFYDATLRPAFGWKLWHKITRLFPVPRTLAAFNNYIDDYLPKIPRWQFDFGDETKCPALFVAAARWIEAGQDPVRVRRMALGELIAWNLALDEAKGDPLKSVKSAAEIAAEREIESEEARHE